MQLEDNNGLFIRINYKTKICIISICEMIAILVGVYLYRLIKLGDVIPNIYIVLILLGFTYLLVTEIRSGIIFKDEFVYYKNFIQKKYNISSIKGVKTAVTYDTSAWGGDEVYKTKNGNILYTVFYLKSVDDNIRMFDGKKGLSSTFANDYHKNILFSSVYDERVIQYLKTVNPDIEIMD